MYCRWARSWCEKFSESTEGIAKTPLARRGIQEDSAEKWQVHSGQVSCINNAQRECIAMVCAWELKWLSVQNFYFLQLHCRKCLCGRHTHWPLLAHESEVMGRDPRCCPVVWAKGVNDLAYVLTHKLDPVFAWWSREGGRASTCKIYRGS